jgi:hypothetical protein
VDVKVSVASHFWKLPSRATDAFTKNLIVLSPGVISKTGIFCARLNDGSTEDAKRQKTATGIRTPKVWVFCISMSNKVSVEEAYPRVRLLDRITGSVADRILRLCRLRLRNPPRPRKTKYESAALRTSQSMVLIIVFEESCEILRRENERARPEPSGNEPRSFREPEGQVGALLSGQGRDRRNGERPKSLFRPSRYRVPLASSSSCAISRRRARCPRK